MESNNSEYTIEKFFEEMRICIPIIQRDYAHGRKNQTYVRAGFLKDIRDCIKGKEEKELVLDFVYGYNDRQTFYPLDGQQRLTTLWLVYWYLALNANERNNEKERLKKFRYKTRRSSDEFCENLCENIKENPKEEGLVEHIQNQTWFSSSWKKDPTINSMLRMIGGTDKEDGIELIFEKNEEWKTLLERFKRRIRFHVLKIGNEQLPIKTADKLYVRMNARGKALTDFENFKADLTKEIKTYKQQDEWEGFIKKMDCKWSDLFWRETKAWNNDGKIDDVFFSFINRFCFCQLCLIKNENDYSLKEEWLRYIDELYDENSDVKRKKHIKSPTPDQKDALLKYNYFYEDEDISYEKFELYGKVLAPNSLKMLERILDNANIDTDNIVNEFKKVVFDVVKKREKNISCFSFIPQLEKNAIAKISQKEHAYFYAICKYFDKCNYNSENFKAWLRFSRNIIENPGIDSASELVKRIRLLDEYGAGADNIESFLQQHELTQGGTKIDKQIDEEIIKAKKAKEPKFKEKIKEAEDWEFLCGCIRFLYTDGEGKEDWDNFDEKYEQLKTDFGKDSDSFDFVKNYAQTFQSFDDVKEKLIFHKTGWGARGDSWLDLLVSDCKRAHDVLMRGHKKKSEIKEENEKEENKYVNFINSEAFKDVVNKNNFKIDENLRITSREENKWALYKARAQSAKLYFDSDSFKRNEYLKKLRDTEEIYINPDITIGDYYIKEDVDFKVKDFWFVWTHDDEISKYKGFGKREEPIIKEASSHRIDDIRNAINNAINKNQKID